MSQTSFTRITMRFAGVDNTLFVANLPPMAYEHRQNIPLTLLECVPHRARTSGIRTCVCAYVHVHV